MQATIPNVDLSSGFARYWNNNNPVQTHIFNAFSFAFPQAERYFVDTIREAAELHPIDDPVLEHNVKTFITQELSHRKQHQIYNQQLERQGYNNIFAKYLQGAITFAKKNYSLKTRVAACACYEHYTSILGVFLFSHLEHLTHADPRLKLVWLWHAHEELEHRSVCFDVYQHIGGNWLQRNLIFLLVSLELFLSLPVQLFTMLRQDRRLSTRPLNRRSTFALLYDFTRIIFSRQGAFWHILKGTVKFLSPQFHPEKQSIPASVSIWKAKNKSCLHTVNNTHD